MSPRGYEILERMVRGKAADLALCEDAIAETEAHVVGGGPGPP